MHSSAISSVKIEPMISFRTFSIDRGNARAEAIAVSISTFVICATRPVSACSATSPPWSSAPVLITSPVRPSIVLSFSAIEALHQMLIGGRCALPLAEPRGDLNDVFVVKLREFFALDPHRLAELIEVLFELATGFVDAIARICEDGILRRYLSAECQGRAVRLIEDPAEG